MSKFKGGLEAYKQRANQETQQLTKTQDLEDENVALSVANVQANNTNTINTNEKDKTNRKQSKEYQQVNSYVPKQLYKKVKIALVEEERGISDLISELLSEWINRRNKQ